MVRPPPSLQRNGSAFGRGPSRSPSPYLRPWGFDRHPPGLFLGRIRTCAARYRAPSGEWGGQHVAREGRSLVRLPYGPGFRERSHGLRLAASIPDAMMRHPSPEAVGPASRQQAGRRYADAPAAAYPLPYPGRRDRSAGLENGLPRAARSLLPIRPLLQAAPSAAGEGAKGLRPSRSQGARSPEARRNGLKPEIRLRPPRLFPWPCYPRVRHVAGLHGYATCYEFVVLRMGAVFCSPSRFSRSRASRINRLMRSFGRSLPGTCGTRMHSATASFRGFAGFSSFTSRRLPRFHR